MESLNQSYPLIQSQKSAFARDGHILLRQVATGEEIAHFRPVISHASYKYNTETRKMEDRDTYGKAFLQIMNLWRQDEEVRRFVFAHKFAGIAAGLLGVDKVRLYHDQALYKEPEGGPTPWHQDHYYWPLDTDKTVTMWMPLIDITEELGMLTFASGSHLEGMAGSAAISDESEAFFDNYVKARKYPVSRAEFMSAGDATFHHGWCIHSAGANHSKIVTREVMTIIYFADGARVSQPQNDYQENDRRQWLDGLAPGELADSAMNPVL